MTDELKHAFLVARNAAFEEAAKYHDLRVEAAEEDATSAETHGTSEVVSGCRKVAARHAHYARGIRALKTEQGRVQA